MGGSVFSFSFQSRLPFTWGGLAPPRRGVTGCLVAVAAAGCCRRVVPSGASRLLLCSCCVAAVGEGMIKGQGTGSGRTGKAACVWGAPARRRVCPSLRRRSRVAGPGGGGGWPDGEWAGVGGAGGCRCGGGGAWRRFPRGTDRQVPCQCVRFCGLAEWFCFLFFLCAWRLAPRRPPRVQLCWWSGWGDCRRGGGDARATAVMGAREWPPTRWARWLGGYRHGTVRVAAPRRLSWPSRQVPRTPRVLHAACPARGMAAPLSIRVACARRWAPR